MPSTASSSARSRMRPRSASGGGPSVTSTQREAVAPESVGPVAYTSNLRGSSLRGRVDLRFRPDSAAGESHARRRQIAGPLCRRRALPATCISIFKCLDTATARIIARVVQVVGRRTVEAPPGTCPAGSSSRSWTPLIHESLRYRKGRGHGCHRPLPWSSCHRCPLHKHIDEDKNLLL